LYKHFWIKAVISLPTLAFEPYTSTRTSVLIAQKKEAEDVKEYEKVWKQYQEKYEKLRRDLVKAFKQKELSLFEDKKSFKEKFVQLLRKYFKKYFKESDSKLTLDQLKKKYQKRIKEIDEDWWVFSKVSTEMSYDILMAEVKEIGYKRTKRSERERSNYLFEVKRENGTTEYIVNIDNPKTALDYIRRDAVWY